MRISAIGMTAIRAWLDRHHKRPEAQNIDAWVRAAEINMDNNTEACASVEIPAFDAVSGHVECLTLDGVELEAEIEA